MIMRTGKITMRTGMMRNNVSVVDFLSFSLLKPRSFKTAEQGASGTQYQFEICYCDSYGIAENNS